VCRIPHPVINYYREFGLAEPVAVQLLTVQSLRDSFAPYPQRMTAMPSASQTPPPTQSSPPPAEHNSLSVQIRSPPASQLLLVCHSPQTAPPAV